MPCASITDFSVHANNVRETRGRRRILGINLTFANVENLIPYSNEIGKSVRVFLYHD